MTKNVLTILDMLKNNDNSTLNNATIVGALTPKSIAHIDS